MYKRFPLKKISKSKHFYLQYISEKNHLLQNIDFDELDKILIIIKNASNRVILFIHVVMVDLHR